MKRNPSRLLEKENPRERLEPFRGVAGFYCIEEQHNRHAKRITNASKNRA
jgi:hypothetical protein